MKKLSSKGFSTVEAFLLVVIISAIGGVGYYVYRAQKKTDQTFSNTTKGAGEAQKAEQTVKSTEPEPAPEPTKSETATATEHSYAFGGHKLFYTPPAGWHLEEYAVRKWYGNAYEHGSIVLKSPEYKEGDNNEQCRIPTGKVITISLTSTTDSNEKMIKEIMSPSSDRAAFLKNQEATKLGGQNAVRYQSTPGECGLNTSTSTVKGNFQIYVSAASDDVPTAPFLKSPYNSVYNAIAASVRFE